MVGPAEEKQKRAVAIGFPPWLQGPKFAQLPGKFGGGERTPDTQAVELPQASLPESKGMDQGGGASSCPAHLPRQLAGREGGEGR